MAVGRKALQCYEDDNCRWLITIRDPTGVLTTIANARIELVIKVSSTSLGGPLVGPVVCPIVSAHDPMQCLAVFQMDIEHEAYNVSVRRTDIGDDYQLVDAALTVLPSGSKPRS